MEKRDDKKLNECVDYLTRVDIPVLKKTARKLSALMVKADNLSAREIAQIIKDDPLMTVKLMRYQQYHKHRSQDHEVVEVEQLLMMLGLENALKRVPAEPLVEDLLGSQHRDALVYLLKVIHRAKVASNYAFDWAVRLHDLHYEEVRIAALLHDIAEILMWCFAPKAMLHVRSVQTKNKTVRSQHVQEQVLGFSLHALQLELATQWKLPQLLITLMDDSCSDQQRVRNVFLAVSLARHAANGWDDAALPDDYAEIGHLLNLKPEEVMVVVGADTQSETK